MLITFAAAESPRRVLLFYTSSPFTFLLVGRDGGEK